MSARADSMTRRGLVVSDLHLFARRSMGAERFAGLRARLAEADLLVLNGDIFDFRWSTLPDHAATIAASSRWLRQLAEDHPRCEIHYVLGNHDWFGSFREELQGLCAGLPRLRWHEERLRLGSCLFVHGDCTHYRMDAEGFRRYRQGWNHDRRRTRAETAAYRWVDRLGLTLRLHHWQFPRQQTVERLAHYLDSACPGWQAGLRDCYFGHTHLPFSDFTHGGIRFHNTGSGIAGQEFNPLPFVDGNLETTRHGG